MIDLPLSQGALIRRIRGDRTQAEFAKLLEVERSSLSRYESESLGAPTSVLNYCLKRLPKNLGMEGQTGPLRDALKQARATVKALELLEPDA